MPSLLLSSDGSHTLVSELYGVPYHSRHGAITESEHVFLQAGFYAKVEDQQTIRILEVGLGSGLNAFMTWLAAEKTGVQVHYLSLETNPVSTAIAKQLNYPEALNVPERKPDFLRLHQAAWETSQALSINFTFEKRLCPVKQLQMTPGSVDLVFYDAFAPSAQADMWEEELFVQLFDIMASDAYLLTYCAQGEFRRRLKRAGFRVEKLPGPPGKREMTRGIKSV